MHQKLSFKKIFVRLDPRIPRRLLLKKSSSTAAWARVEAGGIVRVQHKLPPRVEYQLGVPPTNPFPIVIATLLRTPYSFSTPLRHLQKLKLNPIWYLLLKGWNINIWFGSISSVCICILLYMTIPWQGQLVKCCISDICNLHPVQVICNLYSALGPDRWKISLPGLFSSAVLKSWYGIWWQRLTQIPRNSYSWSETLRLRATRHMFFVLRIAFIS